MNVIHFKQLKFGFPVLLCLFIVQNGFTQTFKAKKPLHLFFETGYHTASFIKNNQLGILYKNQEPKLSFLRMGISLNKLSISLTRKNFIGYNNANVKEYSEMNFTPGEMMLRYYQILDLGFSYSFPINKSLFIEPSASLSFRRYASETLLKYHQESIAWWGNDNNLAYYYNYKNFGLGAGLQIRQNLFKGIYMALETQYQTFRFKDPIYPNQADPIWRNYKMNRSLIAYNLKVGLNLNLRRNKSSNKKEIISQSESILSNTRR